MNNVSDPFCCDVTATFDYAPYGAQTLGTPPAGPGYTGHVNDPDTGLVYMQARYYDPVVGRFLSVDPVGPSPGDTFNFNRYDYANNNPINHTDPDGRQSFSGSGSTLVINGDCHKVNNCSPLAQVNEMTHRDAKTFVTFQGAIIVSAAVVVVAPRVIAPTATVVMAKGKEVAKIIKAEGKEVAKQALCGVLALTCPNTTQGIGSQKYKPDSSYVEKQRKLDDVREQIIDAEQARERATRQLPPPPPPPPPPTPPTPSPSG